MNCLFYTNSPNSAASQFYAEAFAHSKNLLIDYSYKFRNVHEYESKKYDIIFVMTYDHENIPHLIRTFNSKICLIDPRSDKVTESAKLCDFLIVDSIEMEDHWRRVNKPIFKYVEYPDIASRKKTYVDTDKITIGYHGNSIHLDCMSETVTPAIEELAKDIDVKFVTMLSSFSERSPRWMPKGVEFEYIPWSMKNYDKLGECDIRIVPNNILQSHDHKKTSQIQDRHYNYSNDDYTLRFKMPSNPGRFVIFGKLGIPVIAEFYPSALQFLDCRTTGYVANSKDGWLYCFRQLLDKKQREKMGTGLQNFVKDNFSFEKQNYNLEQFLKGII